MSGDTLSTITLPQPWYRRHALLLRCLPRPRLLNVLVQYGQRIRMQQPR